MTTTEAKAAAAARGDDAGPIVQFLPFQSTPEASFWIKLNHHKLNTLRLDESPVSIGGSYSIQPLSTRANAEEDGAGGNNKGAMQLPGRMRFDQDSLTPTDSNKDEESGSDGIAPDGNREHNPTDVRNEMVHVRGSLIALNTKESFRTIDKNELVNQHVLPSLLAAIRVSSKTLSENDEEEDLSSLLQFFCLSYLDLKSHKVLYWFHFAALLPKSGCAVRYAPSSSTEACCELLSDAMGMSFVDKLHEAFHTMRRDVLNENLNQKTGCPPYFLVLQTESLRCVPLNRQTYQALSKEEQDACIFGFFDPTMQTGLDAAKVSSDPPPMGWTLRNLVAYMTFSLGLESQTVQVLSFRPGVLRRIPLASLQRDGKQSADTKSDGADSSLLLRLVLPTRESYSWEESATTGATLPSSVRCGGWEMNARSRPGPRSVDLAPLLSPSRLAEQATDLNLRLMKWRMIPNLNLDVLSEMSVLLLGAGTLGCSVARTLLGWGVRKIVFVDNGKVSYSNPVRQNLFELDDCKDGGKYKAVAAAEALQRIGGPSVQSEGVVLSIPMPGHAFGAQEEEGVRADVEKLHSLVEQADAIFLLTDTRESRWLPTVQARACNKMLINAALGLDSWLVMRHGGNQESAGGDGQSHSRLGCYFCNDVVAPENSTQNRTLDQQCTVTRPGLAPIASSMAVELMVALLHHSDRQDAPAPARSTTSSSTEFSPTVSANTPSSALGTMPHQIRGSIVTYTMMTPTVPAFRYCTGCSDLVVKAYCKDRFEFVKKTCCSDASFLEEVAGLKQFHEMAASKADECMDWDVDD